MKIEHDTVTGRFVCPWCELELWPTRRDTFHSPDGWPLGYGDEYQHSPCGRPYVLTPFPDHREALHRNVRALFPPAEEAA
jgi:hypothetical protein